MSGKQKLELPGIGKDVRRKLELRHSLEPANTYHAKHKHEG
jgi:hypothetical protein